MNKTSKTDIPKGPIAWMAGNSVVANLLMALFLVGGFIWAGQIRQELFPESEPNRVAVSVAYPGASPQEVEQGIILAVEQAIQGLDGAGEIVSTAREGSGTVSVEVLDGSSVDKLSQDIQNEVNRISTLPVDSERPRVSVPTRRRDVLALVVYGQVDEHILKESAQQLEAALLADEGISQVEITGGRDLEIAIEISKDALLSHNLTLAEVASRIRAAAVESSGGGVKTDSGEILLRITERRDKGVDFARLPIITAADGSLVLLEDIATITDGFEDTDVRSLFNGQPALLVEVFRVGSQTPISVSAAARTILEEFKQSLPPGVFVDIQRDRSEFYQQRLNMLLKNAYIGLSLVLIFLGLFLEARLAFWVAVGIPVSFLGSLLILPWFGVTINMISLFAFIIALGIVVDDAVVVGENVYSLRQKGMGFLESAITGTRQVAMPVVFSVLTNIVAFMPLLFVSGWLGQAFVAIPFVVMTVFSVALVECLFILPAHLGWQKKKRPWGPFAWLARIQQGFGRRFMAFVHKVYAPFLEFCLQRRYITLAAALLVLAATAGFVQSGRMGMTLMPRMESDFAFVEGALPFGSPVARTEAVMETLLQSAQKVIDNNGGDQLVKGIYSNINGHALDIRIYLTDPDIRPISTREFIRQWREYTGEIPGMERLSLQADRGGMGGGAALTIEIRHSSIEILEEAALKLADALSGFDGVTDVDSGLSPGKRQMDFTLRPEGKSAGITAQSAAQQVRHAFYGATALRQQRGHNEVSVMVRLPAEERASAYDIEKFLLATPSGGWIPLAEAVNMEEGRSYTSINRRDGRRILTAGADIDPPRQEAWVVSALVSEVFPKIAADYPGLSFEFVGRQADMAQSIRELFTGLGIALIVMYAMLAIPLRSYSQPAIIMTAIPFGIVGAVIGHLILGYGMSVMSLFGIVALSGVVINNALLLIDFANRAQAQGSTPHDAIAASAVARFRPVVLTTLTTFGGLGPMIFETSRQARFVIPMAVSLGFGILFATIITLVLVPCLFLSARDIKDALALE
ncbi:MAG: efflux RND transporter permease subunit [Desulfatibacillaceae bacterium]|nr:efflux RND transporter permease subunit [Desulfatibacillaceae bacterium]